MTLGPKQKATAKAVAFCFGFRRPEGGFTLRYFNAQGGKAAPAQFPACGREFTRHSARGPEGPLGDSPATVLLIPNIDFNRPSSASQATYRLRRAFHFMTKRIARSFCCSSLPNRTRLRSVWVRRCAAVFSYRKKM